ncbi:hypothetical protein SS50377_28522 [Spironucleus salmonicida]|uniref:Uncharacterized protein n=1 Tax=Spironucleus salmonicida TaxID=348837 RepID=V6LE43_9EUKA|nr:hypothetical protein SS50377_28522 [Spironucleus salmonicida]|eukprot:EST42770.1 Hypothetical protein SS50377_17637 [Spironucleus salmonicida]
MSASIPAPLSTTEKALIFVIAMLSIVLLVEIVYFCYALTKICKDKKLRNAISKGEPKDLGKLKKNKNVRSQNQSVIVEKKIWESSSGVSDNTMQPLVAVL